MKKILLSILALILLPVICQAQTYYTWRYREAATCSALTGGKAQDQCKQTSDNTVWICAPTAGDCDTAGEWHQVSSSGGGTWGSITGTLSNQTDLNSALSGKEPTLTKGNATAGTGISVTGGTGAIIGTGVTITNTAPDQTVSLTGGGITAISGTYPSFTITSTETDPQVGILTSGAVCQGDGSAAQCNLTQDGSGDCGAGAVCTGGHTHSSYLTSYTETDPEVATVTNGNFCKGTGTAVSCTDSSTYLTSVASDSTWTTHNSYPAACGEGQYVRAVGDTLTCITIDGTVYQSKTLASANILVGNGSGVATAVAMSGDVTINSSGATAIGADSVALGTDTTGNYAGSSSEGGSATTALALSADGTDCPAGQYARGIDTAGNATGCSTDQTGGGGSISGLGVNLVPVAASSTTLVDSVIYTSNSKVGIGLTSEPKAKLTVDGALYIGTTIPSWSSVDLSTSGDAKFSGDVEIDGALYVDGFLYGNGSKLTGISGGSMTYPGVGVAVSTGSAWDTSLSTDGNGDCTAGAVCLGNHTHSGYQAGDAGLTSVAGLSFTSLGYVKATAADTFAIDTTVYQPQDNGLTNLATLAFSSAGMVRQTASDTFTVDTTVYVPTSRTVNGSSLNSDVTITTISGNAGTATALASNPTDCSSNQFANAIAANGNLTCSALADADVPDVLSATQFSNLTTNGIIRTESGNGTLSVDTTVYAPYSTFTGLTSGRFPRATGTGLVDGAIYQNATGFNGVAFSAPVVQLQVDGALYVGQGTAPTWTDVIKNSEKALYVKGSIETDGSIYTDASGDTLLNYSGGNVLIGTTVARNDLTIDGTIYSVGLTVNSAHGSPAYALCLGLDGIIYGISSGSCH